jgi:zinc protease
MPTVAAGLYRQLRADPVELADLRMAELMTWPHRKILPSEASLAAVTANDLRRLLEPPLTKDALEVTIVGDVDEAAVSEAVARTLGALPPRAWTDHARPDAPRYHFAPVSPAPITVYHEGIKDEALVQITWPLFVWAPERVHESRVIGLVSRVLQDELIERIRQKLGKSYSPLVALDLPHSDAQGSLRLYVKTAPAYVETVRAEALNIARDLAAGRLSAEQLAEARGPWLSAIAHQRAATGWLVETLNGSVRHPDQLTSARGFEADIAGITLEEARAEAARWLARRPYIILGLPKPGS